MSHRTTAATRQYEMKLNITLPTTITGAAARAARTAGEGDDCLPSEPAIHRSCREGHAKSVPRKNCAGERGGGHRFDENWSPPVRSTAFRGARIALCIHLAWGIHRAKCIPLPYQRHNSRQSSRLRRAPPGLSRRVDCKLHESDCKLHEDAIVPRYSRHVPRLRIGLV